MASRLRPPEDVRIALDTDDDWILVRKHLTAGEQRRMFARQFSKTTAGAPPEVDVLQLGGFSQATAYLLDWSILDSDGKPLVIRGKSADVKQAALEELPPEKCTEITAAIIKHDQAMEALREMEKKDRAGETASSATSVSAA
jgi:hypothetical protein